VFCGQRKIRSAIGSAGSFLRASLMRSRGVMMEIGFEKNNLMPGRHLERQPGRLGTHERCQVAACHREQRRQGRAALSKAEERHGKDYYDKVFIVAHSHGGTITRLAMNLWDKEDGYYDPVKNSQIDELKHDDECPTCLRTRNDMVGRNSVRRPDGVITFGSPFVTFEGAEWRPVHG
jgi:hypothetical protein